MTSPEGSASLNIVRSGPARWIAHLHLRHRRLAVRAAIWAATVVIGAVLAYVLALGLIAGIVALGVHVEGKTLRGLALVAGAYAFVGFVTLGVGYLSWRRLFG